MKTILTPLLTALFLTTMLVSCSGLESKAEKRAKDMCACAKKLNVPLNDLSNSRMMGYTDAAHNCSLGVIKGIRNDMKGCSKKEERFYIKTFLKALIDTDCSDKLLMMYDEKHLNQLIQMLDR